MEAFADKPLVSTIGERCRVCYTCVRECPAKAIRIKGGQAAVIEERCIGCGNCLRVCGQGAKQFRRCTDVVRKLLAKDRPVAACLAPSFPAEFTDIAAPRLVGMIRRLGFASVHEVAFGADLVADRYRRLLERDDGRRWIATTCPAVVGYVERYHPDLVEDLAPLVSPMVALARALRELHGPALRIVFIGPCVAKKREALSRAVLGDVDSAITFLELREMFAEDGLLPELAPEADFDPPRANGGRVFPVGGGLAETAGLDLHIASGRVVATDGRTGLVDAINEFAAGPVGGDLLDVLACRGCVDGPGMTGHATVLSRRAAIARHARAQTPADEAERARAAQAWRAQMDAFAGLDLSRSFHALGQGLEGPSREELASILERMGKKRPQDELNCGACGYDTCREHARAVHAGLAEPEMCLPGTIEQLRRAVGELAASNAELASAREALMQAEKLASMGQLSAGIAHEVNNPLGVVLMYAHLLLEGGAEGPRAKDDLRMIVEQADRCRRIVSGLLDFARQNKVIPQRTNLRALVNAALETVAVPPSITLVADHEAPPEHDLDYADLDRDQIVQVLSNLVRNAVEAMPDGGRITVAAGGDVERVRLRVTDTGTGIPARHLAKVFEPFFTTKPMGRGTGLGLAVAYGIVKMHRGDIRVQSNADAAAGPTGTTFTVTLPRFPGRERA